MRPLPNKVIADPIFNLREICKQMILLEDHLVHPSKRCPDCITKHFLMIEALSDEMGSLDPINANGCGQFSFWIRSLHQAWLNRIYPCETIAVNLRSVRKNMCRQLFGY